MCRRPTDARRRLASGCSWPARAWVAGVGCLGPRVPAFPPHLASRIHRICNWIPCLGQPCLVRGPQNPRHASSSAPFRHPVLKPWPASVPCPFFRPAGLSGLVSAALGLVTVALGGGARGPCGRSGFSRPSPCPPSCPNGSRGAKKNGPGFPPFWNNVPSAGLASIVILVAAPRPTRPWLAGLGRSHCLACLFLCCPCLYPEVPQTNARSLPCRTPKTIIYRFVSPVFGRRSKCPGRVSQSSYGRPGCCRSDRREGPRPSPPGWRRTGFAGTKVEPPGRCRAQAFSLRRP